MNYQKLRDANSDIRKALYELKFALEQDMGGREQETSLAKLREALDLTNVLQKLLDEHLPVVTGPANESNPLLVDTLSSSLNDPFNSEPPTNVVIKHK